MQLGFFLSPIVYDESVVPTRYIFFYSLNPITRLIDATRRLFLQHQLPLGSDFEIILFFTAIFLLVGLVVFSHLQSKFAEEL